MCSSQYGIAGNVPPKHRRTGIYIVCSLQGQVGTTLTARLLLDYFLSRTGAAIGFDTNHLDPDLATVFPRNVEPVDLTSTRGQMSLFDRLIKDDKIPKVVDLWHVSYDRFFNQAGDFGFFEEARDRNLKCLILLQIDPKERFAREVIKLVHRCPGADVVLVENEYVTSSPLPRTSYPSAQVDQRSLFVPSLDSAIRRLLDQPEVLVQRFACLLAPEHFRDLQKRLREALSPVFQQFELIEVALDLGLAARSLLPRRRPPSA